MLGGQDAIGGVDDRSEGSACPNIAFRIDCPARRIDHSRFCPDAIASTTSRIVSDLSRSFYRHLNGGGKLNSVRHWGQWWQAGRPAERIKEGTGRFGRGDKVIYALIIGSRRGWIRCDSLGSFSRRFQCLLNAIVRGIVGTVVGRGTARRREHPARAELSGPNNVRRGGGYATGAGTIRFADRERIAQERRLLNGQTAQIVRNRLSVKIVLTIHRIVTAHACVGSISRWRSIRALCGRCSRTGRHKTQAIPRGRDVAGPAAR